MLKPAVAKLHVNNRVQGERVCKLKAQSCAAFKQIEKDREIGDCGSYYLMKICHQKKIAN